MNARNIRAAILIVIAAGLWGAMPLPVKKANFDPLWTAWVRSLGNAVMLGLVFWRPLKAMGRPKAAEVAVGGCFFLSLFVATVGMGWTSSTNAMVLGFVSPFAALAVEVVIGKRRARAAEISLMLAMLAGLVVMSGGLSIPKGGDLLSVAAGVFWGGAMPKGQSFKDRFLVAVLWQQLLGIAVIPAIAWGVTGAIVVPIPSIAQCGWLLLLVVVGSVAYALYVRGTSADNIAPHINLSLQVVQVVSAACLGFAFLGEPLGVKDLIGAVLILGSAFVLLRVSDQSGEKG